ncbi:MAG: cytochrome c biogenesis protein CcsA, partial [Candidatus Sulfotelmatobacter sp.]
MAEIGSFALLLALALSVYSFVAGIIALVFQNQTSLVAATPGAQVAYRASAALSPEGNWLVATLRRGSERIGETARRAGVVTFAAVFLAAFVLVVCAFQDNFTIAYIFHHSNRDLSGPYKFAVLWSGQEGSLLFWSLLLAAYGFVLRLRYKTDPRLFAYASVVLAGVQIFFLLLVNFAANPFGILAGPLRADGSGLNPLLQYPEMVIHPPMLYLGYVGFTVPFAFAL